MKQSSGIIKRISGIFGVIKYSEGGIDAILANLRSPLFFLGGNASETRRTHLPFFIRSVLGNGARTKISASIIQAIPVGVVRWFLRKISKEGMERNHPLKEAAPSLNVKAFRSIDGDVSVVDGPFDRRDALRVFWTHKGDLALGQGDFHKWSRLIAHGDPFLGAYAVVGGARGVARHFSHGIVPQIAG